MPCAKQMICFSCELYRIFQSRHTITFCHSMISVACQRMITSAHHNAEIRCFQPQLSEHVLKQIVCVSYGLSLGWQRLSNNSTHMFNTQKASMLSFVHFSLESLIFQKLPKSYTYKSLFNFMISLPNSWGLLINTSSISATDIVMECRWSWNFLLKRLRIYGHDSSSVRLWA